MPYSQRPKVRYPSEPVHQLKAQLNIACKAYEDAKNELRFISKYALDVLIKEFDL